jgi:hypothetical protein
MAKMAGAAEGRGMELDVDTKKMHQNPIIRGELRKTVINVLSILTFISCQNGYVSRARMARRVGGRGK